MAKVVALDIHVTTNITVFRVHWGLTNDGKRFAMTLHDMAKVYTNMHLCKPRVYYLPRSSTTLF